MVKSKYWNVTLQTRGLIVPFLLVKTGEANWGITLGIPNITFKSANNNIRGLRRVIILHDVSSLTSWYHIIFLYGGEQVLAFICNVPVRRLLMYLWVSASKTVRQFQRDDDEEWSLSLFCSFLIFYPSTKDPEEVPTRRVGSKILHVRICYVM